MKPDLENILIDCLRETLHIMLCYENPDSIRLAERAIKRYPIYGLFRITAIDSMHEMIKQVQSWHCCIIDTPSSFASEGLAVVRDYESWLPTIELIDPLADLSLWRAETGVQNEPDKAAGGADRGNSQVVARISNDRPAALLSSMLHWAIKRKLIGRPPKGLMEEAMDFLFRQDPTTVDEWSTALGVRPRKFQREFKHFTNLPPKKLLALYHAYRIAFESLSTQEEREKGVFPAYVIDERMRDRVMEYVLTRRSTLLAAAY